MIDMIDWLVGLFIDWSANQANDLLIGNFGWLIYWYFGLN